MFQVVGQRRGTREGPRTCDFGEGVLKFRNQPRKGQAVSRSKLLRELITPVVLEGRRCGGSEVADVPLAGWEVSRATTDFAAEL